MQESNMRKMGKDTVDERGTYRCRGFHFGYGFLCVVHDVWWMPFCGLLWVFYQAVKLSIRRSGGSIKGATHTTHTNPRLFIYLFLSLVFGI